MQNEKSLHLLLRKYLVEYLPVYRKFSNATIRTYKQALNSYRKYLEIVKGIKFERLSFENFNRDVIYGYLVYMRDVKKSSVNTLNLRLCAIKCFLRYCGEEEITLMQYYTNTSTIKNFKGSKKVRVEYLTSNQLKLLFQMSDVQTRSGRRNRFFMILSYELGLRMSEALNLKLNDLMTTDTSVIRVRINGKGNKIRYVPLMENVVKHLDAYLKEFHPLQKPTDYLFYIMHNFHPTQMKAGAVDAFLKKYAVQANTFDSKFPLSLHEHMLRHSIAMAMYKNGIPLSYIRDFLGHVSYETTQIYAYADEETITKALESLNDISPNPAIKEEKRHSKTKSLLEFCGLV